MSRYNNIKRLPRKLLLGEEYIVYWYNNPRKVAKCILIQPTEKGFNFLNTDTNKCILKNHLYPSTLEQHKGNLWLWLNTNLFVDVLYKK